MNKKKSSIEKAQEASILARKAKAERKEEFKKAVRIYNQEKITLPVKPIGTPEENAKLHALWGRFFAIQDRIKRLHTGLGRTTNQGRRETLLSDMLAANDERSEIEAELRSLRRRIAGPEVCKKVDIKYPNPKDFGLTPDDVK